MKHLKLFFALFAMLALGVGNAWAEKTDTYEGAREEYDVDNSSAYLIRDNNKCVLCRRCVATCAKVQEIGVIGANNRGIDTCIGQPFDLSLNNTPCISCGQCTAVCPTGALVERDDTDKVWAALADPTKHVVVQTAPSIRATLGECFDMPIGTNVEGKMVAALRRLGFEKVFSPKARRSHRCDPSYQ